MDWERIIDFRCWEKPLNWPLRLVFRLACYRRHDTTIDFVLFDNGDGDLMPGKVCFELAIRNRANRQLIKEILPPPENQQHKKEIGDAPLPPRRRLIYLSRFFDRKIDLWFSLHGYPLIRTVHTGVAISIVRRS